MTRGLPRRASLVGWGGSLALHAGLVLLATLGLRPPDTGFEFQAPMEVELGLAEATEVALPSAPASEPPPPPEPPAEHAPTETFSEEGLASAPVADAGPPDAGPRDAGPRRRRDGGASDGGADAGLDGGADAGAVGFLAGGGPPVAFLPAGAQLALRVDMDRVRASPIADDVTQFLAVVPDWQALLGGSGVEPVRDLSRVLLATPDLQRASVVVAGRLADGAPDPRAVAEQLAAARGVPAVWRQESGIDATRWPSPDPTTRDIGLLDARHFVIARPEDLPRVLAIAADRQRTDRPDERDAPPDGPVSPESAAEALLSMHPGEGVSIEVENVAAFVRRSPCPLPLRLRVGITDDEQGVRLGGDAVFERADDAATAQVCLADLARRAALNVIVTLYGLSGPLERLDLRAEGTTLHLESAFRLQELRTLFTLLRGLLSPAPVAPAPAAPAPPVPAAVPPP